MLNKTEVTNSNSPFPLLYGHRKKKQKKKKQIADNANFFLPTAKSQLAFSLSLQPKK
jgi:hypothetical protein